MAKMVEVTIQLDEELKECMEKVCAGYGISIETAFILFMEKTVCEGHLPFELTEEDKAVINETKIASMSEEENSNDSIEGGICNGK